MATASSIIVWVLVLTGDFRGGPLVIDNIASQKNCQALAALIDPQKNLYRNHNCLPVRKIVVS